MNAAAQIDVSWRSALMLAVCLPVLLTGLALLWHKTERVAAVYLGLFLMAAVIKVIPQIIGFAGFYAVYPGLTFAPFNVEMLFGPLLFFHAHHLMMGKPDHRYRWLFLPGVIQILYYTWAFVFLGDYQNKWRYNNAFHEPFLVPVEVIISVVLFVFCWGKIILLTRNYEKHLEHHESAAAFFKPIWIYRLLIALTVLLVLFLMVHFMPTFITDMSYIETYPLILAIMVLLSWVGLDALRKLTEPFPKPSPVNSENTAHVASNKTEVLDIQQITTAIESNQWFLEPRFSLRELAERLGTNETYISRSINQGLNQSFNQYINHLRIELAKDKLLTANDSVIQVALASGFNSKATFNRVFKSLIGMTPSQYKRLKSQ